MALQIPHSLVIGLWGSGNREEGESTKKGKVILLGILHVKKRKKKRGQKSVESKQTAASWPGQSGRNVMVHREGRVNSSLTLSISHGGKGPPAPKKRASVLTKCGAVRPVASDLPFITLRIALRGGRVL